MSRRPANPGAERAAQNQQTLKTLVKVESNKTCADCKQNKHPRWASWNLGVFLCIRCSGIHRGMGTHISRVKSVDLDAWTDEQLQSILRWGNARANKYWEAKLAPGHVPSEAKIENFIRTKYDSKRWVMDGPMPDPSTLDADGDDEMPLNVVQEKAKMERSTSLRAASNPTRAGPVPGRNKPPEVDLFADDTGSAPQRSSSAAPSSSSPTAPPPPPKQPTHSQKSSKGGESLLGFDFFSNTQSNTSSRPSSGASGTASANMPSRPDLKQSILSLYSSAPKTSTSSQQQTSRSGSISSNPQQTSGSGLDDAFSSLNFGSPPPQPTQPVSNTSSFSNLANPPTQKSTPAEPKITSPGISSLGGGGGGFFDSKPKPQPQPPLPNKAQSSNTLGDFGAFTSAQPPQPMTSPKTAQGNGLNDLLDFSGPAEPAHQTQSAAPKQSPIPISSPFNLSSPKSQGNPAANNTNPVQSSGSANPMSNASIMADPWGSNDAWASTTDTTPAPAPKSINAPLKSPPVNLASTGADWGGGWGESPTASSKASGGFSSGFGVPSPPKVTADEDFGGWSEALPAATTSTTSNNPPPPPPKPLGFSGGGDDLFSNVWE